MAFLQTRQSKIIFGIVAFIVVAAGITVGIMAATGVFKPKSPPPPPDHINVDPVLPIPNTSQPSGIVAANIADEHDLVAP
mgnify:CR=1 FL=1